ncbi:hypothetical protein [Halapricum salinum]|uniref:Uncharacterized protein n=1 Tax=Halapricum salinum TaxID=1457250 RepID=A0A4D6HE25_9EURY|nr:hypothetical protein [Halapricum salinum]QCC51428.1 hypothetical protein DV733_09315 [Halapricum salinum]
MDRTEEFHPQDWLLIAEALSQWRLELRHFEPERADRAAELIERISDKQGLDSVCIVAQINKEWSG